MRLLPLTSYLLPLAYCLLPIAYCLLPLSLSAQVAQLRWDIQVDRPVPHDFPVWQGETVDLMPRLVQGTAPVAVTNAPVEFRYREAALATNVYRYVTAEPNTNTGVLAVRWIPDYDAGAAWYDYQIIVGSNAANPRAFGRITMRPTIGWQASTSPPPAILQYATTAQVQAASNALAEALQALGPRLDLIEGRTNYWNLAYFCGVEWLDWLNTNTYVRAESDALALEALAAFAATNRVTLLYGAGGTEWVSVASGTATLWRVETTSNLLYQIGDSFQDHLGSRPPAASYPHPFTDGAWQSMAGGGGYGIINTVSGAMWYGGPGAYPLLLEPQDERAEGTATYGWIEQTSTNAVGAYVTAAELAAALAEYNPAAVTQALDVAEAAFVSATNAQARAQAVDQRLTSATNAIVRTYFASSNAWIEVDYSNKTAAVVMVGESGTNSVLLSEAGASLDPAATNAIWIAINQNYAALSAALALKAPAAWGQYAPDGSANPEPDYMTFLNAPATLFGSGCSWSTYGTYAVLSAPGATAFAAGSDGMFRIGPNSTNWFGFVQGGSVIVGAQADSLAVTGGGTSNGYAEITYPYESGDWPSVWFTPQLSVDFTLLETNSVAWADNLDGTATVTVPATTATGFWSATTSASFANYFQSTMPARFTGGVLGSTNDLPVVYDSVIQIESGGKTYRIPAQEVP